MSGDMEKEFLGESLLDYYKKGIPCRIEIIRDDGNRSYEDIDEWLSKAPSLSEHELKWLDSIRGKRVLDIGCGSGRFVEYLKKKGYMAYGIDISSGYIEIGRLMGRENLYVSSAWDYMPSEKVDAIIMDGSIGLIGEIEKLQPFIKHLSQCIKKDGQLLVAGTDWSLTKKQKNIMYQQEQVKKGKYPGATKFQIKIGNNESDFFDWVLVDLERLIKVAREYGFEKENVNIYGTKYYVVFRMT